MTDPATELWAKLCHECYAAPGAKCTCLDDIRAAFAVETERLRAALTKISSDEKNCTEYCRRQASRALEQKADKQKPPPAR